MNPKTLGSMFLMSLFSLVIHAQNLPPDTTISFTVNGVCVQCQQRIQKSLKIKGVRSASWDIPTHILTVRYAPALVTVDQLHEAVTEAGHDTGKKQASEAAYKALPECCRYREMTGPSDLPALPDTTNPAAGVRGVVIESREGHILPLAGASLSWLGDRQGATSDQHGAFYLLKNPRADQLVVSYAGFKTDTVALNGLHEVEIRLSRHDHLEKIVVTARQRTSYIDERNPFRMAIITKKELLKAACCNLSESFETNPSVDVSYNDAATGSKQIQLLGLAGVYTQLTVENLPGPRGIATPLGLNSIAGPWVESIQMIKGAGSVVNGYESIAGQINIELKKPQGEEKLYVNAYVNDMGKTDANLNWSHRINGKWSTAFLLHDDFLYSKQDFNGDGFRDLPTGNQFSAIHRWQYTGDNGLMTQFGLKVLRDDRTGGSLNFDPARDKFSDQVYGLGIQTERYEAFGKIGYVFPRKTYQSIGWQLSASDHSQNAYFGRTIYDARQKNFYSNLIFQSRIGSPVHTFKTGLSFLYDNYREQLNTLPFKRQETVPGAFAEYNFTPGEKWALVAGLRTDHNSLYGWFLTPRFNLRYTPFTHTTIRISAGRGQRTADIFAENIGVLVSARQIQILGPQSGKAYGLDPEVAWNKGISLDQKFHLFNREASWGIDFYRNDFSSQVVVDLEDPRTVKFYNLNGRSYSNSFQTEVSFLPIKKGELRLAYRLFDVRTRFGQTILSKPLTARHRGFANFAYELRGWKLDYTLNVTGSKRLPPTGENPAIYQLGSYSPAYVTMNAQVSKSLGKNKAFDLYVGGENLTGYFQHQAILAARDPFSQYFDASMVWGPVSGRLFYAGFRYSLHTH
ncbi:MAG: TonB-dependent receptor domain-containing protein [Flavisolibacter sp.]